MARSFKRGVKNDAGIFNARKGLVNGKEYIFTHRNPKNEDLYCEDFPVGYDTSRGIKIYGQWFSAEKVQLL